MNFLNLLIELLLIMEKLIFDFTEKECREYFKEYREKVGIRCKKCTSKSHYWLKGKEQWQCKNCKFRTTLKSGTTLQHSNMKISSWLKIIYWQFEEKGGVSAKKVQRKLGHKRYEPVWAMMHKIRKEIGVTSMKMEAVEGGVIRFMNLPVRPSINDQRRIGQKMRMASIGVTLGQVPKGGTLGFKRNRTGLKFQEMNLYEGRNSKGYLMDNTITTIGLKRNSLHENGFAEYRLDQLLTGFISRIRLVHRHVNEDFLNNYLLEFSSIKSWVNDLKGYFEQVMNRLCYLNDDSVYMVVPERIRNIG